MAVMICVTSIGVLRGTYMKVFLDGRQGVWREVRLSDVVVMMTVVVVVVVVVVVMVVMKCDVM